MRTATIATKKLNMYLISSASLQRRMHWLVDVTHKVHNKLQCFGAHFTARMLVCENSGEFIDLGYHALLT